MNNTLVNRLAADLQKALEHDRRCGRKPLSRKRVEKIATSEADFFYSHLANPEILEHAFWVLVDDVRIAELVAPPGGSRKIGFISDLKHDCAEAVAKQISARRIRQKIVKESHECYKVAYGTPTMLPKYLREDKRWGAAKLGIMLGYKAESICSYLQGMSIHRRLIRQKFREDLRQTDFERWALELGRAIKEEAEGRPISKLELRRLTRD